MKILFAALLIAGALVIGFAPSYNLQAQTVPGQAGGEVSPSINDPIIEGINITGSDNKDGIAGFLIKMINTLLLIVALVATVMVIYAGLMLVLNAGNESRVAKAKTTLLWAIIGLVVSLAAFALVSITQGIF